MAEVQQAFAELFQENQNLKEQNRSLQDEITAETMYPFRESVRWKKSPDSTGDDGPFCPTCFANTKKIMPLRFQNRTTTPGVITFICPEAHPLGTGMGRSLSYQIKETSIKPGRYHYPD
jgi:hypothetical protein